MNSIKPSYYNVIIIHDPKRTMFAAFRNRNDKYNHNNDWHYMNCFFLFGKVRLFRELVICTVIFDKGKLKIIP